MGLLKIFVYLKLVKSLNIPFLDLILHLVVWKWIWDSEIILSKALRW